MSALWLEFTLILCVYGTARTAADEKGVVWRNVGESITIQCNSTPKQQYLNLKKGLNEEEDIFYTAVDSSKPTIDSKFTDRLQSHEKFPKVDILIKNLTLSDTGPYWCVYKMMDKNYITKTTRGSGSMLLVVTGLGKRTTFPGKNLSGAQQNDVSSGLYVYENRPSPMVPECDQSMSYLVLVYVVICAAVVIFVLTVSLIWIILKKMHTTAGTSRDENVFGRANSREDTL